MSNLANAVRNGEHLALTELASKAGIQNRKYRHSIPLDAVLTPAGTAGSQIMNSIKIATEGDFYSLKFACKLIDTDALGTVAGVSMQITETGYGKKLFRDWIDLSTIASPGFGVNMYPAFDLEQLFLSGSEIQVEYRNSTNANIRIYGALHGWQFLGTAKSGVSGY
jgi:hypothetical protein